MSLSVSSGSYRLSEIVGSRVYGSTLPTVFTHYPSVWTMKRSVVGTRVSAVLFRGLLQSVTLNPYIHSTLWGNSTGIARVANFLSSFR